MKIKMMDEGGEGGMCSESFTVSWDSLLQKGQ